MAGLSKPNELHLTRIYEAPVKAVWEAWTDPNKAAQWWGPRGFTITTHSKDLRVGGQWVYTMHGPEGVDYPNSTTYHEVEKYARLVYDHGSDGKTPPLFRVTVLFSESKGKTKMEMTMAFETAAAAANANQFIKEAGGNTTWDRLAEYLAQEAGQSKFYINRVFAIPQDKLFAMWTDPKHLAQWLPPTGFTMQFIHVEVKSGGGSFYSMSNGEATMYGRIRYLEIHPDDRVVYTQQFCDKNEKVARHPMSTTWPETMLTTLTFAAEDESHTRVTIEWAPYGQVTEAEVATFIAARAGMTQGWTGSLDKLDDYIAARS